MRLVSVASPLSVEPPWIVHELASQWFLPTSQVAERLGEIHHQVDAWVTSGTFVLAPPLYVGPEDHPVFLALAEHVRARHPDDLPVPGGGFGYWDDVGSRAKVQHLLQIPAGTLDAFPVRGRTDLLHEMQRLWRFPHDERRHETARLQRWLGTYGPDASGTRRHYEVAPVGPVSSVEKWLLEAPGRLEPFGYAVTFGPGPFERGPFEPGTGRYVGTRVRLDNRSTLDLVGRVHRSLGYGEPGDLVVIDLAATAVGPPALERLMRHVYTLRRRTSAHVHGLLVADGVSVSLRRGLWEQGLDHVSLSELGYRDYLLMHPDVDRVLEPSDATVPHPTSLALDLAV